MKDWSTSAETAAEGEAGRRIERDHYYCYY